MMRSKKQHLQFSGLLLLWFGLYVMSKSFFSTDRSNVGLGIHFLPRQKLSYKRSYRP